MQIKNCFIWRERGLSLPQLLPRFVEHYKCSVNLSHGVHFLSHDGFSRNLKLPYIFQISDRQLCGLCARRAAQLRPATLRKWQKAHETMRDLRTLHRPRVFDRSGEHPAVPRQRGHPQLER